MFARRATWDLAENALARRLAARCAAGLPVLDLTDSNPTRCELPAVAAQLRVLERTAADPAAARYDPDPRGDPGARAAVAAYYAGRGAPVDPAQVILTAGTSEGYAHVFRLLGEAGDEVLVPRPSYPLFDYLAGLADLEVRGYPLRLRGGAWRVDLEALRRAIGPRARLLVAVHPNNPTGSFLRWDDARALAELCRAHDLALLSDEVFADYGPDAGGAGEWPASLVGPGEDGPLRFVLSGLSKLVGLPQLKLAWIVAAGPAEPRAEALARLELIADTYLSVSGLSQLAAPALLRGREAARDAIAQRVRRNRAALDAALAGVPGVERLPCDGGWSAILRAERGAAAALDEEALAVRLLDDAGILLHPGYFFELEDEGEGAPVWHLVASLLPPPSVFDAGIAAALDALRALRC